MIDIEKYISRLTDALRQQFAERLLYVGLQGSYLRGEATESSDIDIMVVIDGLSVTDLDMYREIIRGMEHTERSCGFICSKTDLANWNPLEIFHILHTTKDYFGNLSTLIPAYTRQDICNFVKISVNNLYHAVCHEYVHGNEHDIFELTAAYKSVFFILQNLLYLRHGTFVATKAEILPLLNAEDSAVLQREIELSNGIQHDFADSFSMLFKWCRNTMQNKDIF